MRIFLLIQEFLVGKSQGGYMAELDLKRMNAADAIRQAVIIANKTQEEIEAEAGLRPGSLDQFASRRDAHWPSMLHIPELCRVCRTDLLIQWQLEQYLNKCLSYEPQCMEPTALLREIVRACGELGDVSNAAQAALTNDSDVDRKEAMAIRREAMEVVASMFRIVNGMGGLV